jgi:hypothetical protein
MYPMLEHPEIGWIERTGYPSWMQENNHDEDEYDEDAIYDERRERELC